MGNFKFSIIVNIHSIDYLKDTVNSVIDQDIGFEENVQLVLVNKSADSVSEEACLEYMLQYSNNIIYVRNSSPESEYLVFNNGLRESKGELVMFLNQKDKISLNALSSVWDFYHSNKLFIDFVVIPRNGNSDIKVVGRSNTVIDLTKTPSSFSLAFYGCFYKRTLLDELGVVPEHESIESDILNIGLYELNPKFGYVVENGVTYYESNHIVSESDKDESDKKFVTDILKYKDFIHSYPVYVKEIIVYRVFEALQKLDEDLFSLNEIKSILEGYKTILKNIDDDFIIYHSTHCGNINKKLALLQLKYNISCADIIKSNKYFLDKIHRVIVRDVKIEKGVLKIEASFSNFGCNNLELVLFDGNSEVFESIAYADLETTFDSVVGCIKQDITHIRRFEVPIKTKRILKFAIYDSDTKEYHIPRSIGLNRRTKFELRTDKVPVIVGNRSISFNGRRFKITKVKDKYRVFLLKTVRFIYKKYKYFAWERLFSLRKKRFILINDRPEKAGDNGEALFKYICENRKDMAKNTYFVISKKSEDYVRMKKYGNVVDFHSIKHKLLFLNAKYVYSSHNSPLFIYPFEESKVKYYSDLLDYKFEFIQHGVAINDISKSINRYRTLADSVISSFNQEYVEFNKGHFLYEGDTVKLTGLPRFDYLEDKKGDYIVVCPTWRRFLTGGILYDGTHEVMKGFEKSEYFSKYASFLLDERLHNMLKANNLKIKFVLHPGMAGYVDYFNILASDVVEIVSYDKANYNKFFNEARLMVTDYSSVFIDFGYLKKPLLYYQFDKDKFFGTHYKIGYFDYDTMGFGEVVTEADVLINRIEKYINNDFVLEQKYVDNINNMFAYTDRNNCQRVIEQTYKG